MLTVAILTWDEDLLIKPCPEQELKAALQWIKERKQYLNRFGKDNVDFILFDSGYFLPLDFDRGLLQPSEEQMVELYEHSWKRPRIWDANEGTEEGESA